MQSDYLKYWRVIRKYACEKYNITPTELDMMLFLYSEKYFNRKDFERFDKLLPWDKDRLNNMIKAGWIDVFREWDKKSQTGARYVLSFKARRAINSIYKKLDGEDIPMTICNNPMFKKKTSFTNKVYKQMIMYMNNESRRKKRDGLDEMEPLD